MPRLTIIVPLMDQVESFEVTLASVLRYLPNQADVLVVHTGDYSDEHGILDEVPSMVVNGASTPSILGRVAVAAAGSRSPWVVWLAPGIEWSESWAADLEHELSRADVGLISPRIRPRATGDSAADGSPECLASSVALNSLYHPVYLEEVLGEHWRPEDIRPKHRVLGPTGWGGFARRTLLEDWSRTRGARLPDGYADAALGLYREQTGWQHEWTQAEWVADDVAVAEIERGFTLCGRSSNQLLAMAEGHRRVNLKQRAVGLCMSECLQGWLAPSRWRIVWQRLQSWHTLKPLSGEVAAWANDGGNADSSGRGARYLHADSPAAETPVGRFETEAVGPVEVSYESEDSHSESRPSRATNRVRRAA